MIFSVAISALLFIAVNGPPIDRMDFRKHVICWLKLGRQSALDKATHTNAKEEMDHRLGLFATTLPSKLGHESHDSN
jgi:hypothetical protein